MIVRLQPSEGISTVDSPLLVLGFSLRLGQILKQCSQPLEECIRAFNPGRLRRGVVVPSVERQEYVAFRANGGHQYRQVLLISTFGMTDEGFGRWIREPTDRSLGKAARSRQRRRQLASQGSLGFFPHLRRSDDLQQAKLTELKHHMAGSGGRCRASDYHVGIHEHTR